MKNGLSLISKASTKGFHQDQFTNEEFGFSFNDIVPLKSFTDSAQSYLEENVYAPVKATATDYLGEKTVAKLGDKIEEGVKKQGAQLEQQVKDAATNKLSEYAQQYASKKDVQDSAIQTGFQAAADKMSQYAIDVKDTYRAEGVSGLFKKYPVPFYVAGGVTGLLILRFVMGGKKKVYVTAPNPRKRRKKK